jgi:uncharacterized membrane protein
MKRHFFSIVTLSFLATVNALYLSYKAYYVRFIDPLGLSSFCDVSQVFSCTDVLRSSYSLVFGVSFPWVALAVYPLLATFAVYGMKTSSLMYMRIIAYTSIAGLIFNLFIIYREMRFIHAYCLLCLVCTIIIATIASISWYSLRVHKK